MLERYAEGLLKDLADQKEVIIFQQLNNLVKDGILQIEQTEAVIVQDACTNSLKLQQAVRLTFHAEEVVENYRRKVERLVKKINSLQDILNDKETSES
jgi:ribosome-binding factor A